VRPWEVPRFHSKPALPAKIIMNDALREYARTVAYIPARLGSVRVARKNLRHLAGRPLVTHVTRTASTSRLLDLVYLNTESQAIAATVAGTGVQVYLRDPALAAASTSTDEILYDFAKAVPCETIVVINPTAPLLSAETIDRAVRAYHDDPSATLFTTTAMSRHLVFKGDPINFNPRGRSPRTQDLEPFEFINFIIFVIARAKVVAEYEKNGHCLYAAPISFLRMSGLECHDIDDEEDFQVAEALMQPHRGARYATAA